MKCLDFSLGLQIGKVIYKVAYYPLNEDFLKFRVIVRLKMGIEREIEAYALCNIEHISRLCQNINV